MPNTGVDLYSIQCRANEHELTKSCPERQSVEKDSCFGKDGGGHETREDDEIQSFPIIK